MDPLTIWILALATLWLLRMLVEELVAAIRGQPSPRLARREAREKLAREHGRPTVGQALEYRLAERIAHPPDRQWLAQWRALLTELAADAVGEARVRHHVNRQTRARRHARQAGWRVRTGGTGAAPPGPPPEPDGDEIAEARPCRDCGDVLVVEPDELCEACERAPDPPPPPGDQATPDDQAAAEQLYDGEHYLPGISGYAARGWDPAWPGQTPEPFEVLRLPVNARGELADVAVARSFARSATAEHIALIRGRLDDQPDHRLTRVIGYGDTGECWMADNEGPLGRGSWPVPYDLGDDGRPPVPPDEEDTETDWKEHPMTSATHSINGDVRDPRTALAFATSCRELNDGVARELDILAATMGRVGVGPAPIGEIRVLGDAARTYSTSAGRSITKYAEHVVAQADIAGDDDVRDTVRRTYLDTHGSDAGPAAPQGGATKRAIYAADCDTPGAAARLMDAVADAYAAVQASVDQAKGMHQRQGVSDEPVQFLAEQLELATQIAQQAKKSAATFRAHIKRRDDTVGKDGSLHGTQAGRYLDPARA